ncbi:MATE family efflux transporter [Tenuibacillus multivorans]|uniref:Putative efflux protein, MATE family n=1 Tax=Tenuibacillus multivorans TaxID=237069 RepID=A0A1H0DHN8_9BACI|nr:MATE family efflux transporter [Tenuibacillus multivorans]GEL76549.1 putative multidrug resistance protein YpnP [Tenuibacillus multivorans]SDN69633.1 putative efflux protein, MATE family [Tenuibacillus multivorans]
MGKAQHDFTKGNILKQLIVFSGPLILANLLQTSYQFIDSLWVSNLLGDDALGSVAISSTIIFTLLSFVIGISNAQLTILSQQKGRDDEEGLRRYLNAFVVILTVLASLLGLFGFLFSEGLLRLLGTPSEMMHDATLYLQINFLGILFLFGYNFISTVLRALGDSKTPFKIVAVAVILNVFLDPFFIYVLNFGISGAAYATILSQGIAFLLGLIFVLRRNSAPFSIPFIPNRKEVGLILNLGIPSGLQTMMISAGSAAIMTVVTSFGPEVVSGFSAAQRLGSLIMLPAMALGTAVNSMAGQNIGIGNMKRVSKIAKTAVLYNFTIMVTIGLAVIALAKYGVSLFIHEEESILFGTRYLQVIALCYPFLGINFILNGIVRASGAMYQVLVLNIISFWILRYPLSALFSKMFGDIGISIGMGSSFIISSLVAYGYFRFGKWRGKALFNT